MFEPGDAIIHPMRGAGIVVQIEERQWQGNDALYYRIKLIGQPGTSLMVPVSAAEEIGLRRAITQSELKNVWRVLRADPETLPADHKTRYKLLEDKLHTGDALRVAEAVRDMAWRKKRQGSLTTMGKRIYREGLTILAGEIAATQGDELANAEAQIRAKLEEAV
ncbi:MAG: hypothetical protein DRI48_08820 [Chloroflexi bacterium]|nr:MAG: hypothetical protein DRI48_08820 [Chloroflexota bacterium]